MSEDGQGAAPEGHGGDTGGDGGDWRSNLPDQLVSAPFFRSADSLEAAVADLARAAEVAGNSLRIPGPDASDEARAEFYDKIVERAPGVMRKPDVTDDDNVSAILRDLGLPAEANEYALETNDALNLTDERVGELKAMAHQAGLTRRQFDKFMGLLSERDTNDLNKAIEARDSALGELKGEWGAAYDQRLGKVRKVMEDAGADASLIAALDAGELGATDLRMFHNLADRLSGEGGAVGDQGKPEPDPIMTPYEATMQLKEIEDRLIGKYIPEDQKQALVRRRMELIKLTMPQ